MGDCISGGSLQGRDFIHQLFSPLGQCLPQGQSLHKSRSGQLTISYSLATHTSATIGKFWMGGKRVWCVRGWHERPCSDINSETWVYSCGGSTSHVRPTRLSSRQVRRYGLWRHWIWSCWNILMSVQLGPWDCLCCYETSCPFKETILLPFPVPRVEHPSEGSLLCGWGSAECCL